MRIVLIIFLIIPLTMHAMDDLVITIADAYEQAKQQEYEKRLPIIQQKNELLQKAEENMQMGLYAFGATWLWLSKMCCYSSPLSLHPTQADAYILGCTSSFCCIFCTAACCDCYRALRLKNE